MIFTKSPSIFQHCGRFCSLLVSVISQISGVNPNRLQMDMESTTWMRPLYFHSSRYSLGADVPTLPIFVSKLAWTPHSKRPLTNRTPILNKRTLAIQMRTTMSNIKSLRSRAAKWEVSFIINFCNWNFTKFFCVAFQVTISNQLTKFIDYQKNNFEQNNKLV